MRRIMAVAVLGCMLAMVVPAMPIGTRLGGGTNLLIAPMAYWMVMFNPLDWAIGYVATRFVNWAQTNGNDPQYVNGTFNAFGSGCPNCNGTAIGGGGGGGW